MALRKPLVVIDGLVRQLPTGDSLDAVASEVDVVALNNGNTLAAPIGTPIYISAANTFLPARANAGATVEVLGFVRDVSIAPSANGSIQTDGVLVASAAQWDVVTGQTGGLTSGAIYFLDAANVGRITNVAPTTLGQYVLRVGKAVNTTSLEISIGEPILL